MKKIVLLGLLLTSAISAAENKHYIPDGYRIETIKTPELFHITGLDIDKAGVVYVATRFGDVWTYRDNSWHQFASGLHEPTGLLLNDDGSVYVAQKPELTQLVDVDHDGVADEYINVSSGWQYHDNYHEFNFGPVKDKKGNLFGLLNLSHGDPNALAIGAMGSSGGYRGWAYKIDKKGNFSPYASGLRSPAGIGTSPKGEVFFTDNQGDWVPTSKLHLLEEGAFYGHPVSLIDYPGYDREKITNTPVEDFEAWAEKPNVWIPHIEVANSPGNPTWDTTKGKFGPFSGQIFIGDQTQSNVFRVLLEKVKGRYQGAVINFADGFQSGNIRTAFSPTGELWVGQTARGWSAKGNKPYGLQKLVWNGSMPFELLDIKLTKKGFRLAFTEDLHEDTIDRQSFSAREWNYKYSSNYGSPKIAEKDIPIAAVIRKNPRTLDIELALTPGKVVMINFDGIKSAAGRVPTSTQVYYTLNATR